MWFKLVKDSLKSLLDKYPYFLDKNVASNFYRVVQVQNENFKQIYQSLVDVYESFHLNKKILAWKEQETPYSYTMRFVSTFPNIKKVNVYMNDVIIHTESYPDTDSETTFNYSYTHDTRNDLNFTDPSTDYEESEAQTFPEAYDNLLVWRVNKATDDDTIRYSVNVKATYTYLKSVTVYKNDTVIHTKSYSSSSNETVFEYEYNNVYTAPASTDDSEELTSVDDVFKVIVTRYTSTDNNITKFLPSEEASYIPEDLFLLEVETYDEYTYQKGFPENDTSFNKEKTFWDDYVAHHEDEDYPLKHLTYDPYDHDLSLDYMGYLNNIPRKEYIEIDTLEEYYSSEPAFNNRRSEDDYHYMKRMLEYNLRLFDTPAPVLEIWKLYGLDDVDMVNREHLLLKMFDITKHDHHVETRTHPCFPDKTYETLIVDGWVPEPWEHKDQFFLEASKLGEYFFAEANTVRPVKNRPVTFTFKFLNSLAEDISKDYLVDIYLNDTLIVSDVTSSQWICSADLLDEYNDNVFLFVGKTPEREIGRVEITVVVRGCTDADFFVRASGSDTNDGSRSKPFKTIRKALDSVTSVLDLIAVVGEVTVNNIERVPKSCTLLGCKDGNITPKIINTNPSEKLNSSGSYDKLNTSRFFNVAQDQTLIIQDIQFKTTEPFTTTIETVDFTNENPIDETETVLMYNMDYGLPVYDSLQTKFIKNLTLNNSTGYLSWDVVDKATELPGNLSYDGVINTLELITDRDILDDDVVDYDLSEDEFYYYEHYTHEVTTSSSSFDNSFLYFSDRLDMLHSTYYINDSLNDLLADGLLDYDEYDEEIIYDTREHGLDEFQYQHISGTQGTYTSSTQLLRINLNITNPVVNQIIDIRTSEGATAQYKVNSISGSNISYKPTSGSSSATTNYITVKVVKDKTSKINIDLKKLVNNVGFVYVGSSYQLSVDW